MMRDTNVILCFFFFLFFSSPVLSVSLTALPANRWKSFFGVNTHTYTTELGKSTIVKTMALYLGVGAIRDDIEYGGFDSTTYNDFVAMNNAGIKLNAVGSQWEIQSSQYKNNISEQVIGWANFQAETGMIESIEGYNEINITPFVYDGIDPSQSYKGMIQAQIDLYNAVKANSNLKNLPVYDETDACITSYPGCNSISGRADYANIHPYPTLGAQSIGLDGSNNVNTELMNFEYPGLTSPTSFVITETGYHTSSYPNGVSETAQAKLVINALLNALQMGFKKTFIYEIWDQSWYSSDYADSQEGYFGFFRADQSVKPSGRAAHFFSQLLSDTSGQTTSLTFSLSNFPTYGKYILFQKSNGQYMLVFWINLAVYNGNSHTDITNNPVTVTVGLPWSTTVNVYDIFSTTASDQSPLPPISTQTGSSVSFSFSDKAVVLEFAPGSAGPTQAPSPACTIVTGTSGSIVSSGGNVWTITSGAQIAVNGVVDSVTSYVVELAYVSGLIWQLNEAGDWYSKSSPSDAWSAATTVDPTAVCHTPAPTPKPTQAPSPGCTIVHGTSGSIVSSGGNVWTITSGAQIAVNGVVDSVTSYVVELAYVSGLIWQLNEANDWYSKSKPSDAWSAATTVDPTTVCNTPKPTPKPPTPKPPTPKPPTPKPPTPKPPTPKPTLPPTPKPTPKPTPAPTQAPPTGIYTIFDDALTNPWYLFGRLSTSTFVAAPPTPYSGTMTLKYVASGTYGNVQLQVGTAINVNGKTHLRFAAQSAQAASSVQIQAYTGTWSDSVPWQQLSKYSPMPVENAWTVYYVPLQDLAIGTAGLQNVVLSDATGQVLTYYYDLLQVVTLTPDWIFDDALQSGWSMRYARATVKTVSSPVFSGTVAYQLTLSNVQGSNFGNLELYTGTAVSIAGYTHFRFAAAAGNATSALTVQVFNGAWSQSTPAVLAGNYNPQPVTSGYTVYTMPLSAFSIGATQVTNILILDDTGGYDLTYYIDQIGFVKID